MDPNITKRNYPAPIEEEGQDEPDREDNRPIPAYRCHKIVNALKITAVDIFTDYVHLHHELEDEVGPMIETLAWHNKHRPQPGGYYVIYQDGYTSWSPAEAFEDGYSRITAEDSLTFGDALVAMEAGARCEREGWNGRYMWIAIQHPDPDSKMTEPYIYMRTSSGALIPWLASQADMLARDWIILS